MVRYLFYTIGDLTYQSPLVLLSSKGQVGEAPVRQNSAGYRGLDGHNRAFTLYSCFNQ